ncbi:MAG TPA: hypothetical protein VET48_10520 [Steroidobacteraceae bacterium]|nr:hypothetical protein [Steroidobacteraceae bacterium]
MSDTKVSVTPITQADLSEIGNFLNTNLNRRISSQAWIDSVTHAWSAERPNFGMQMRDGTRLVGVFCAIYSDQSINGKLERFCNPHSWCVLESHRSHGINLVLALIRQRGYHFTMLTPNPKVAEIFRHFKFKDLADEIVVFYNLTLGGFGRGAIAVTDREKILSRLPPATARDYELHRSIPWLEFLAFGRANEMCLIAYKRTTFKKMPCANIMYISDPMLFDKHDGAGRRALFRKGFLVSKVERRFLTRSPRLAYRFKRTQAKLFLSPTLNDSQIKDLYTELASLDI